MRRSKSCVGESPEGFGRGGSVWGWGAGIYSARSLFTTWCNSSRADPCVLAEPIFQVIMWSVPLLLGRITQMLSREETHVDASSWHCQRSAPFKINEKIFWPKSLTVKIRCCIFLFAELCGWGGAIISQHKFAFLNYHYATLSVSIVLKETLSMSCG